MSITLAVGATSVELPIDLRWDNEYDWNPVEQTKQRTLTGGLVISVATRTIGRPIVLAPEDDGSAWTPRSVLDQVRAWAAVPGQQMTLMLRGVAHTVIFDHEAGAIPARTVAHFNDVVSTDWYHVSYRFLEVA